MKRTVLFLAVALLATMALEAFPGMPVNYDYNYKRIQAPDITTPRIPEIPYRIEGKSTLPETQAIVYTVVEQFENSFWTALDKISPVAYEPKSGVLFMTGLQRKFNGTAFNGSYIQLFKSKDNGKTWDSTAVFDEDGYGAFYPSVAVTNTAGKTDMNEIPVNVWAMFYTPQGTSWGPSGGLNLTGTGSKLDPDPIESPNTNNPNNGQYWAQMKMHTYTSGNEAYIATLGLLSAKSANYQYGYYGARVVDAVSGDELSSVSPTQWDVSKFRASTALTSSYQSGMEFDFDPEGNLYAGVFNIFLPEPVDYYRMVGVSKSTDMGATWSDFNTMPKAVIDAYVTSTGNTDWRIIDPYASTALVATGDNEYGYFMAIGLWQTGDQNFRDAQIIECYYKGGAWGIRKAAGINGFPKVFTHSNHATYGAETPWVYKYDDNPLGYEMQISRTKDGNSLILKYIDVSFPLPINPAYTITYEQTKTDGSKEEVKGNIDTVFTTDVFLAVRPVNGTTWSDPVNATNDSLANKASWIPDIVPSLSEIPLFCHHTPNVTNQNHPAYGVPRPILMLAVDLWPLATHTTISPTVTVEEETPVSYDVNTSVYPNPASSESQLIFNLVESGYVSIEVFNSLGQSQGIIYNALQTPGVHAISFDVSGYTPGAYYYTVTSGNHTQTGKFHVVK